MATGLIIVNYYLLSYLHLTFITRFLEHLTNVTVVRGPTSLLWVLNFFQLTLLPVAKPLGHQPWFIINTTLILFEDCGITPYDLWREDLFVNLLL